MPKDSRVAAAITAKICAAQNRRHAEAIAESDPVGAYHWTQTAQRQEDEAEAGLALAAAPIIGVGGDLVPADDTTYAAGLLRRGDVNAVHTEAACERLRLANDTGSVELGADAAESVKAKDPIERTLVDQNAAFHKHAMQFLARADNEPNTIERCRLANTAARLANVSQDAVLTLVRKRSGGQQTMVVQHVSVNEGAQAVIGSVQARAPRQSKG
jgi:hypothetical protein